MRPSQRRAAIAELKAITADLEQTHERALDRLDAWSAGYTPGGPSSGPAAPREHDEECPARKAPGEACACEGTAIDYSDRTGDLATRPDPFRRELRRFDDLLEQSVGAARRAQRIVRASLIAGLTASKGPTCRSCARIKNHVGKPLAVPVYAANLCGFCGRFQSDRGIWPPENVLEAHHRGETMTPRLVERMMRDERDPEGAR